MSDILTVGGLMILCALGSVVAAFIVGYFVAKIAGGLSMTLREKVYEKTMSFSMEGLGKFSISSLITRSTNDITQVQMFVAMGLQFLIKAPIQASWAIVKISGKSWQWTVTTSIAVAILLLMLSIIVALSTPKFKKVQQLTDRITKVARENLTGKYGHQAGDEILRQVSNILLANIRSTDVAARYGGEEFALILPGVGLKGALGVTERIRRSVKAECGITVSLGVSSFPQYASTVEDLIRSADRALYKAKSKGKDLVVGQPNGFGVNNGDYKSTSLDTANKFLDSEI